MSKAEQKRRFLARIDEPDKNWKFGSSDVRERGFWDDYQAAYGDVLSETSTKVAPWYVIPADRKWFMRLAASAVILDALIDLDPQYPAPTPETKASLAHRSRGAHGREGLTAQPSTTSRARPPFEVSLPILNGSNALTAMPDGRPLRRAGPAVVRRPRRWTR